MGIRDWLRGLRSTSSETLMEAKPTAEEQAQLNELSSPQAAAIGILTGSNITGEITFVDKVSRTRRAEVIDVEKMYDTDERIEAITEDIGLDAARSGKDGDPFKVQFQAPDGKSGTKWQELQKRIEASLDSPRVSLKRRMADLISLTLARGNVFLQAIIDWDSRELVAVEIMPDFHQGFYMQVVFDKQKNLRGYIQRNGTSGAKVAEFAPWQIVHLRWNPRGGVYGRSFWRSARRNWNRMDSMEKDMVIGRKSRAYMKLAWIFKGASPEQIKEIIRINQELDKDRPRSAKSDYYTSGDMKVLDPTNTQLANIADVEYAQDKLFTGGRKPKGLLAGHGADVNRATLQKQQESYMGLLLKCNEMGTLGIRQIIDLQLMLWGLFPKDWGYVVAWAAKDLESLSEKTDRITKLRAVGIISRMTGAAEFGYNWMEQAAEMEQEAQASEATAPPGAGRPGALSQQAAALIAKELAARAAAQPGTTVTPSGEVEK